MLNKIKCPKCNTEGTFSVSDPVFDGPYKCWKCKEVFRLRMEHGQVTTIEAMSQEQMEQFMQVEALKNKFRRGG
jgi:hypothetical protein